MSLTAWRICKKIHCRNAFDGEGARQFGGRWNHPGTPLVYLAQSQSLAALELLVHLQSADLLGKYVLIPVEIDDRFMEAMDRSRLPKNWRADPAPETVKALGDEWVRSGRSAVLQVPSTVIPDESNFLLNPKHAEFSSLRIGEPVGFQFDHRLLKG